MSRKKVPKKRTSVKVLLAAIKKATGRDDIVRLTPKLAEAILEFNTDNYRDAAAAVIGDISAYIEQELFVANPADNIVLMRAEVLGLVLLNGQHRMMAVVAAGLAVDVYIRICSEKVGNAVIPWMDNGASRTLAQYIKKNEGCTTAVSNIAASITRLYWRHKETEGRQSRSSRKFPVVVGYALFCKYRKDILFSAELATKTTKLPGINASYQTALAKAHSVFSKTRMREFHEQFVSRHCKNQVTDRAAQLLNDYHHAHHKPHEGTRLDAHEYYLHCEWAVAAFGAKEKVSKVQSAERAGDFLPR